MKKKTLFILIITILALSLSACGKDEPFSYSKGITEDGYWEGITANDYVTLCEYNSIKVPAAEVAVSEEEVLNSIANYRQNFAEDVQVTDRAVVDGDRLVIDYVGVKDGVAFEGGTANDQEVTIGVTSYIPGFLEQLVGHMPGTTFDIDVTFPDPYTQNTDLSGEDAVFTITIQYIIESVPPELTDEFVMEHAYETYGTSTVQELKDYVENYLMESNVYSYCEAYIRDNTVFNELPESMIRYQQALTKYQIESEAESYKSYGITLDTLLGYYGYDSMDAYLEDNYENDLESARFNLMMQAIAEKEEKKVTEEDVQAYFEEMTGNSDFSQYEELFGLPYLKMATLYDALLQQICNNAAVAE